MTKINLLINFGAPARRRPNALRLIRGQAPADPSAARFASFSASARSPQCYRDAPQKLKPNNNAQESAQIAPLRQRQS